jgi:hypothetical protein
MDVMNSAIADVPGIHLLPCVRPEPGALQPRAGLNLSHG